jgi:hypothetical protein
MTLSDRDHDCELPVVGGVAFIGFYGISRFTAQEDSFL